MAKTRLEIAGTYEKLLEMKQEDLERLIAAGGDKPTWVNIRPAIAACYPMLKVASAAAHHFEAETAAEENCDREDLLDRRTFNLGWVIEVADKLSMSDLAILAHLAELLAAMGRRELEP